MAQLNSHALADAIGARAIGQPKDATFVVADSRTVDDVTAFAAVRGGQAFVGDALSSGAPFAIVQDASVVPDGSTAIVVDDTVAALGRIATAVRASSQVPCVAITGSTGKTLTKDFIAAALGPRFTVHATPRSYNAEIGVPLTVLGMPDDANMLVSEVAARHPHDIAYLCDIVRPRTGVITGIGVAHLDVFGSRRAIASTKAELFTSLFADGLAVAPASDDYLDLLVRSTNARLTTVGPEGTSAIARTRSAPTAARSAK
jgi:UDP-N-acetylmuramoyl-tripeptide--D-alanyl-D-alanine ligase